MAITPPEIEKYETHKKWCLTKMAHLVKKTPKAIFQELSDFEKRMLLYNSHPWSRNFKIQFFLTPE